MHGWLCGSNVFLFSKGMWAHAHDPKIQKWVTSSFLLLQSSKGFLSLTYLWGDLFWLWLAQLSASSKILGGSSFVCSMQLAISLRDLFFLSTIPFFYRVYGTVCCNSIPTSRQIFWTSRFTYSPPLSIWRALIFLPKWVSTSILNSFRCSKALDLYLRNNTQVYGY